MHGTRDEDGYECVDGMRFYDFGGIRVLEMPDLSVPEKSGVREIWVAGRFELGCKAGRKFRVFRLFDCITPRDTKQWPKVEVWNSKAREDRLCFRLQWTCLVHDDRDAY